ncbi:hypothetical protein [Paraliobacillus sp. JSM ZJ581]|uniref:hypothetical protein n=1 Tax=Paraliobacillus sp. JSM ZJ581 TaxID=3342118 RepID=UPI0035A8FDF5
MKKSFKVLSLFLVFVLAFSSLSNPLAYASKSIKKVDLKSSKVESLDIENIPEELLDPNYYSDDEIVYIPDEFFDPYHENAIYSSNSPYLINNKGGYQTFAAIPAAAGIYFIPWIGKVALLATGVVVVGGVTVKAGSSMYNKVAGYFAQKAYDKAKKNGEKTKNHSTQSTSTKSSLSKIGKALSSKDLKDSKGVKQRRYYGENGRADVDIDFRHSGNFKFPHRHTWKNGVRSKH